jgi:hypothetical protein
MHIIKKVRCLPASAIALLLCATLAITFSTSAVVLPLGGLAATKSGNDLILSFPTTSPSLYTVQTSPDLLQPWTNLQSAIPGDGTLKTVTISNAFSADKGFYRLSIQKPNSLLLPQAFAFAILHYSCGGIQEKAYVTGFDPSTGLVNGNVYLRTSCSTGRAGSPPSVHTAWTTVTWDLAANVVSYGALSNAPTVNTNFTATDAYGDTIFNTGTPTAYLGVPIPAAPTAVTAVQSGDQLNVTWMLNGINPAAITSSTLIATPLNSTSSVLTTTVAGPATTGVITTVQPQTTYQIIAINNTISGSSPASAAINSTTVPASIPPSAPTGVTNHWANIDPQPPTTNDTLISAWQPAVPGNSPVDQYLITINGSDGGSTFTQTVSGTTLTTYFTVDFTPNWTVTVQAHNAAGWGPSSPPTTLGGL